LLLECCKTDSRQLPSVLDSLLETARHKYLDLNLTIRQESLEKLWDAWERLKTVEQPGNKKVSASALLDRAADEPRLREVLEQGARALTDLGNHCTIRHGETDKVQLQRNEHVDYPFHWLALRLVSTSVDSYQSRWLDL
jgi:hypothetical protein